MRLSATAIQAYDTKEFGGCNRKWYFKYVDGIKEPKTPALELGDAVHKCIEYFLKDGSIPDTSSPPGRLFGAMLPEVERVKAESIVAVERPFNLPLVPDISMTGKIDIVRPQGPLDWKTSSNLKNVPTPFKLMRSTQMQIYAWAFEKLGYGRPQFVSHVYVQTKGPALTQRVDAPLSEAVLTEGLSGVINISKEILSASKLPNANDLKPDRDKCRAGTPLQCPYLSICKPDKETVVNAIELLKARINPASRPAALQAPSAQEVQLIVPADAPIPAPAAAAPRVEAPAPAPAPAPLPAKRGPGRPKRVAVVDIPGGAMVVGPPPVEAPAPATTATTATTAAAATATEPKAPLLTKFQPKQVSVSMTGKLNMGHFQSLDVQVGQTADFEGDANEAFVQLMTLVKKQLDAALESVAGRTVQAEVPPAVLNSAKR